MAEFALGLTKTAVEGTLSLVKSVVEEEGKLREKVQNDLVFITGEFEMMQSFLRVANNNRNDQVVLTWVRQLRNLAFDGEDCVEYVVHLDLDKSSRWGWLRRAWHTLNCRAPPLPLDVAVAEIKELKARVEDVSQRNNRYNLTLHGSDNNNHKYVVMPPSAEQLPDATTYPSPAAFHILRDSWEATGKWRSDMCNLQQEFLITREDDNGLQVISVWGSTGCDLGTASIFRKAFSDPEICEQFKCRAWIKLTHPFNHDEFVKSLLTQIGATSSQQSNVGVCFWTRIKDFWTRMKVEVTEDNLVKVKAKIMQHMREQRYLVVLEGVFTLEEWAVIRMYLPDSKNGSRIVMSTPQLGIALLCAGEPYQVSELRKFPAADNQFLCAFFKNKTPRDMGEFYRQLRHHGVISVWGADDDDKSNLVDILYKGIIYGWFKEFECVSDADKADHVSMLCKGIRNRIGKLGKVEFKRHSWVDVPCPLKLNLKVFAQRLFLNFHSDDIRAKEITEVGMKGEEGLIEWCRKFLSEEDCVVVIDGLQSMDDWDLIKSFFFLSSKPRTKGCILVITNEETVATHCVKGDKYQAFNVKDLEADTSIATLINKGSWHYGIRGMKGGRLFKDRRKDALEWMDKFKNVGGNNNPDEGKDEEEFGVFTVSPSAMGILRHAYYVAFQQIERRSWVDVPWDDPFDLTDFSWRLLLDFYSDDPQAKETMAVGLMEGTVDPIEKCRRILHNKKCLVVINGLQSKEDWDSIKGTFLSDSKHIRSIIIVRSFDRRINTYCSPKVLWLGNQQGFTNTFNKEYRRIFYYYTKRCQKALEWTEKFESMRRQDQFLFHRLNMYYLPGGLGLFSVWGIPGVGKSSQVRTVYYDEILRSAQLFDYPFTAFGWVDVPSPFNLTEFAWRLLLDLYSDDPQAKQTATVGMMEEGQVPIVECCKILQEIRCLVVIDGLRSMQDWDLLKATFLSEPIKGTTIVVITNEEEVAMHCVQNDKNRVVNIRRLEADAALNLFEKIASKNKELTSEEMELSKSIVAKCGGLPKVIADIGEVCRSDRIWVLPSLRRNFMGTLETNPKFHGLRPLFSWMKSYFDACSDSIKPCIFYLSIFSAEKNIRWRRLLWRWIAEGYCRDTSDGRTCEENGEKFISELMKLSIVQQYSPRNNVFCEINGFFHEYIISRPMEDNLVFALEERCRLNSQRAGQHLTIRSSWNRSDRIVYESIDLSRLRSLTVFGKWMPFFISSKNIDMRLLRVLDLEDATDVTNDDLEQIAKLLPRLKFLSLRGHTKITCLPSSMGCLRQLQTLDIRHTSIATLPPVTTKLQKLQYIRAGTSEVWDWEGGVIVPAQGEEEDRASSSAQAFTNLPAAAPTQGGSDSTGPVLPADAAGLSVSCNNRPRTLVSRLLSKLCRCSGGPAAGVTFPADVGKLAVLHTLGVVKVSAPCGNKAIFQELKKLTQLRKLGVSGINKGNIHEFCSAISGHAHLKSLSVELDKDDGLDDNIPEPPKTIQSLKLYGHVNKLQVWMKHLHNLEKVHLTIEKPEELQEPPELSNKPFIRHLRIRPIQEGELRIGPCWELAWVIEIQCSSVLHIKFDDGDDVLWEVAVLRVHFSGGSQSSLQISGLSKLRGLKEVWLKGYTDAHKQRMLQQINEMCLGRRQKRPVLKLVQTRSSY